MGLAAPVTAVVELGPFIRKPQIALGDLRVRSFRRWRQRPAQRRIP